MYTEVACDSSSPAIVCSRVLPPQYGFRLPCHPLSIQPNWITAQKFLEDLTHPSKTGQASEMLIVKGIPEGLKFLENYKPELDWQVHREGEMIFIWPS